MTSPWTAALVGAALTVPLPVASQDKPQLPKSQSYQQLAAVGGDLGGYFNIYYESTPFTFKGKTIRIKNGLRLVSPIRFRNQASVSTDGGPFVNYGNPWFEKDLGGNPGRH